MFKKIIGGGDEKEIICPRCLTKITVKRHKDGQLCDHKLEDEFRGTVDCGYEIPLMYIEKFGEAKTLPVQVFGWSNHGKTVFLDVTRLILMEMRRVWDGFLYLSITEDNFNREKDMRVSLRKGLMPASTKPKSWMENELYIMQLNNMVRWGARFLVIMDHAGERFKEFELETHEIPFITHPKTTTLMIVSIPMLRGEMSLGSQTLRNKADKNKTETTNTEKPPVDSKGEDYGRSMDQLVNIYLKAMLKHEAQQKNSGEKDKLPKAILKNLTRGSRRVVVVLTMADKFAQDLPPFLRDYLLEDDLWDRLFIQETKKMAPIDMEAYLEKMLQVSNGIRDWLLDDIDKAPGGAQLVGLLEKHNIDARYTIISATGHEYVSQDPSELQYIGTEISPKRVLDPFFWVMEYQDS